MNHAVRATRIHLVGAPVLLGTMWSVLAVTFLINVTIWWALGPEVQNGSANTLAISSIYIVAMVAGYQAVTQTFPFAAGMSLTRKAFAGGTALYALGLAVFNAVLLFLALLVERATGGWGVSIDFFGIGLADRLNPLGRLFAYMAPFLATIAVGVLLGTVYKRWRNTGMVILSLGTAVIAAALVLLVQWLDGWSAVGRFLGNTPLWAWTGGYPLLTAVLCSTGAWLILRRSVP